MGKNGSISEKEIFLKNLNSRFYKILDYLSFFAYVLIVSLLALGADFLLVLALTFFFETEISTYPIVKQAFDWYKIGSAFLVFFVAGIHAVFSSYSQIKFEVENIK